MATIVAFPSRGAAVDEVNLSLAERVDQWEYELDLLGPSATRNELELLLARAPDPDAPVVRYVWWYLACLL